MSCEQIQADLDECLAGELSEAREAELRAHVEACPTCAAELRFAERLRAGLAATRPSPVELRARDARALQGALGALEAVGVASEVPAASAPRRGARRGSPTTRPARATRAPLWGAFAAAACLLVLAAIGLREPAPAPAVGVVPPRGGTASPLPGQSSPGDTSGGPTPADPSPARSPEALSPSGASPGPSASPGATPAPDPRPASSPGSYPVPSSTPGLDPSPSPAPLPGPEGTPSPAPDAASSPTPGSEVRAPSEVALRVQVAEVLGSAYRGGEGGRTRLRVGDELAPGSSLEVGGQALVVCALSGAPGAAGQAARAARVVLGPQSTLRLGSEGGPELMRGSALVEAEGSLVIAAGAVRVEVTGGDAFLSARRSGLEVAALGGEVRLRAPQDLPILPGSQLLIEVSGRVRGPRVEAAKLPRWTAGPPASAARALSEDFATWPQPYARTRGASVPGGHLRAELNGAEAEVWFGRSEAEGGLARVPAAGRIRLRYRVAQPTRLTLQLTDHTQGDNFNRSFETARVGLWTSADFALSALDDNAKQGKRIATGDLLGYVALRAPPAAQLELRAVQIE